MPYFRVMLRGHNFSGDPIGDPNRRYGLYTTRWVLALTSKRAGLKAVTAFWSDQSLAIPDADTDQDRAWLTVEAVDRVKRLPKMRGAGATWFSDEP